MKLLRFGADNSFFVGAVLCTAGCLTASLVSAHLLFSHGTENLNPISQMRKSRLGEAQLLAAACEM